MTSPVADVLGERAGDEVVEVGLHGARSIGSMGCPRTSTPGCPTRRSAAAAPSAVDAPSPTSCGARRRRCAWTRRGRSGASSAGASPERPADLTLRRPVRPLPVHGPRRGRPTGRSPGCAGAIWTLARDYPRLDGPEEFRDVGRGPGPSACSSATGSRRPSGGSALVSEARVAADRPLRPPAAARAVAGRGPLRAGRSAPSRCRSRSPAPRRSRQSQASGTITYSRKNSCQTNM